LRRVGAEQQQAEHGKHDLRECLQRGTDRDRGRRVAHAHAVMRELPHDHHRTADLAGRQQAVDRLAGPAREQGMTRSDGVAAPVDQHRNRRRIQHQRHHMKRGHQRETPAGNQQCRGDRAQALPGEQRDEQRDADRQQDHGRASHCPAPLR
jgi:hypothetical protein